MLFWIKILANLPIKCSHFEKHRLNRTRFLKKAKTSRYVKTQKVFLKSRGWILAQLTTFLKYVSCAAPCWAERKR